MVSVCLRLRPRPNPCGSSKSSYLGASMWIYHVPSSPAKQESPLNGYRLLAWRASALGASGVGFWAYGDTARSSAWDDLDGIQPDWSVVYDSESSPISTRRWEGFRQGLEDYRLLRSTETCAQPLRQRLHQQLQRLDLNGPSLDKMRSAIFATCTANN